MLIYSILSKRYTGPSSRRACSPSCKIRFLVSQVYVTIDIHVYFTWISVEEVYSHASNANASMTP